MENNYGIEAEKIIQNSRNVFQNNFQNTVVLPYRGSLQFMHGGIYKGSIVIKTTTNIKKIKTQNKLEQIIPFPIYPVCKFERQISVNERRWLINKTLTLSQI